jgi:chromosome segregation protein
VYLKRLELQGFKSFPEKIKLNFDKGITAVVGPNGSGKSNISDAIRWVIGEKNAKNLRGGKMEDIIFSGTDTRKPLSFAEVSMTIDNQDGKMPINFTEITITRKIYRSGDSEFQINGVTCRLKDIHEIFMDTGIGKEGYSIIGQGRIEEILSAKSEDRRLLFEEAVGIVKYKNRKNEANSKLEKERVNLLRVDDIINEIKQQIEPLYKQSQNAALYLQYKKRLKIVHINIFLIEALKYEEDIKLLNDTENELTKNIKTKNYEKINNEEAINNINQEQKNTDDKIKSKNKILYNETQELNKKEKDISIIKEKIISIKADILRTDEDIKVKNKNIAYMQNNIKEEKIKQKAISTKLKAQENILKKLDCEYTDLNTEITNIENEILDYNSEIIGKTKECTDIDTNLARTKTVLSQLEERRQAIIREVKDNESELKKSLFNESEIQKNINITTINIEDIKKEQVDLNKEKIEEQSLLDINYNQLNVINQNISEASSRLKVLKELKSNFDGYFRPVKYLLKMKENEPQKFCGVCGVVGELIQVNKKYELAIEVALGGSVQNIVTLNEDDAKLSILYLKNAKEGRATFLPVSIMKPRNMQGNIKEILLEKGVLDIAKNVIKYDSKYENIFANILGSIVVVDNIDNGVKLNRKYKQSFKIVTLEGEVLNPGGAISGGALKQKNISIFGKNREIEELNVYIKELHASKDELNSKIKNHNNKLLCLSNNINKSDEDIRSLSLKLALTNQTSSQNKDKISIIEEKIIDFEIENSQLIEQLDNIKNDIKEKEGKKIKATDDIYHITNSLKKYQSSINQDKESKDTKIKEITDLKVDISSLSQNNISIKENIDRMEKDIKNNENEIKKFLEHIKSKTMEIYNKENDLQKNKQNINLIQSNIKNTNEDLISHETLKDEYAIKLKDLYDKDKVLVNTISNDEKELIKIKMKKEQKTKDKIKIYDDIWGLYELTYKSAKEEKEHINLPIHEMKKEEKELQRKIESMGVINISSLEEYKIVKERYDFLVIQKNDILDAEKSLKDIINQLTSLMTTQFEEQFEIISKNFSKVFKDMFLGGEANIVLSDKNNILESGIEIIARPPGKKLSNMSLLSGGERALTATALLFSILMMKPSPFCILDEVEAALDDVNVNRYAEFIKNFAYDTQFILITHRKGTMECADNLYGVTMQEQGVSKLVSVKLSDDIYN